MDGRQLELLPARVALAPAMELGSVALPPALLLPPTPALGPEAVLGAARHRHPSRPPPLAPGVALAVLQPLLGPLSGPVPDATTALAGHVEAFVQAERVPAAVLTWAERFVLLLFLLLILSSGFLFK